MKKQIDATDYQKEKSETIPAGYYNLTIKHTEDAETKTHYDPMVKIVFRVADGEHKGTILYDRIVFPEKTSPARKILPYALNFLKLIGEPHEGVFTVNTDNWIGETVTAQVGIQEYAGKQRNYIIGYCDEALKNNDDDKFEDIPF